MLWRRRIRELLCVSLKLCLWKWMRVTAPWFGYLSRFMSVVACMCLCHGPCLAVYFLCASMCVVFARPWADSVAVYFNFLFYNQWAIHPLDRHHMTVVPRYQRGSVSKNLLLPLWSEVFMTACVCEHTPCSLFMWVFLNTPTLFCTVQLFKQSWLPKLCLFKGDRCIFSLSHISSASVRKRHSVPSQIFLMHSLAMSWNQGLYLCRSGRWSLPALWLMGITISSGMDNMF